MPFSLDYGGLCCSGVTCFLRQSPPNVPLFLLFRVFRVGGFRCRLLVVPFRHKEDTKVWRVVFRANVKPSTSTSSFHLLTLSIMSRTKVFVFFLTSFVARHPSIGNLFQPKDFESFGFEHSTHRREKKQLSPSGASKEHPRQDHFKTRGSNFSPIAFQRLPHRLSTLLLRLVDGNHITNPQCVAFHLIRVVPTTRSTSARESHHETTRTFL